MGARGTEEAEREEEGEEKKEGSLREKSKMKRAMITHSRLRAGIPR